MKNISQQEWVLRELRTKGYVTRNECLGRFISRLSAIIFNLKEEGHTIKSETFKTVNGLDHKYILVEKGQVTLF